MRKPQDKSLAEQGVQAIQRWILAVFRNRVFFSVDEINQAINPLLDIYNNKIMKKINNSKTLTNTYVYGQSIDDVLAYTYNNNTYYYVKDRQGSIRNITNQNGTVVESYSYNSFGKILYIKDQNGQDILKSNVNVKCNPKIHQYAVQKCTTL